MPNAEIIFGHIVDHFFSFVLSWVSGAQNFFQFIVLLSFGGLELRFFHALGILGNGEGIDHRLDVASEEAL